jgi:hypothetical protein
MRRFVECGVGRISPRGSVDVWDVWSCFPEDARRDLDVRRQAHSDRADSVTSEHGSNIMAILLLHEG